MGIFLDPLLRTESTVTRICGAAQWKYTHSVVHFFLFIKLLDNLDGVGKINESWANVGVTSGQAISRADEGRRLSTCFDLDRAARHFQVHHRTLLYQYKANLPRLWPSQPLYPSPMSEQLLDTPAKHPFSVSALADKAWNRTVEAAFRTGWAPIARLAEAAVVA